MKISILMSIIFTLIFTNAFADSEIMSLEKMTDDELKAVSITAPLMAINQIILRQLQQEIDQNNAGIQILKLMNPIVNFLDADIVLKDVVDNNTIQSTINPDGSVTVRVPSSIGEVQFNNIRIRSQNPGPSFGSITIKNIQFNDTKITMKINGGLNLPVFTIK